MGLQPHQERVLQEKQDLEKKLDLLNAFMQTETFVALPSEDQGLLEDQFDIMNEYSDILFKRIERFV